MRNIVTAERNGEKWKKSTHLPRGFWWNKSFFWDFSLSSEQFYGNAKKRGVQKNEVFDSIVVEFKEGLEKAQFKEKDSKNFKAKKERNQIGGRSETFTN